MSQIAKVFVIALLLMCGIFIGAILSGIMNADYDLAAWISAFSTMAAALGTVGTLVFLSWQYRKETASRLESEQKQQEMWNAQKESIGFEKYQTHKQMFNDMLDGLEQKFIGEIEFYDRDRLYKNLFPDNNFSYCNTTIDTSGEQTESLGDLVDMLNGYRILSQILDDFSQVNCIEYDNHSHDYLYHVLMMSSILHINFLKKDEIGELCIDFGTTFKLLNIFNPIRTAVLMQLVLERLCSFSGNELDEKLGHKGGSYFTESILSFAMGSINSFGYSINFGKYNELLTLLYKCYQVFSTSKFRKYPDVNTQYLFLCEFFTHKNVVEEYLNSKTVLVEKLGDILFALVELDDSEDTTPLINQLRGDIRRLKNNLIT